MTLFWIALWAAAWERDRWVRFATSKTKAEMGW
jgi:hypothetical protein